MRLMFRKSIGLAAALVLMAGPALAQQGPQGQDHGGPQHAGAPMQHGAPPPHFAGNNQPQHDMRPPPPRGPNWHQGDHYNGGRQAVDWRQHHLRQPPSGYEWVQSGNQFVMIAIASGVIASIIAASVH